MVFPDFFHAYMPDPAQPLPVSRSNVIVVAVAEYLPRARRSRSGHRVGATLGELQDPLPIQLGAGW